MNIQNVGELFEAAFLKNQIIRFKDIPDQPIPNYKHSIYPLHCLAQLRDEIRSHASGDKSYSQNSDDFLSNYAARFIVDAGGGIRFSREGRRSATTPAHSDISQQILTAGNIYFSNDYSKIVKITNKSGHFKPSFATLVFALPLILASDFPLADKITLVNGLTQEEAMFSLDELKSLKPKKYDVKKIKTLDRSVEVFIDSASTETRNAPLSNITQLDSRVVFRKNKTCKRQQLDVTDFGYETPDENETFFSAPKRAKK